MATARGSLEVVAGLPLAARAILALRAAGVPAVAVFAGTRVDSVRPAIEPLTRPVRWVYGAEDVAGLANECGEESVLVVSGDVLVDSVGVLRAPRCGGSALADVLARLGAGAAPADALRAAGALATPRAGDGLYLPLDAGHPPSVLETVLLDHLGRHTRAGDSYLAALVERRLSRPLTRLLLPLPVTPSQVTLLSVALGLLGAAGLATLSYPVRLAGVLALVASAVLDCVDGELARARFQQSPGGARLDVVGDYAVNLAAFAGLGVGLWRQGLPPAGLWAVGGLAAGVVAAMLTVHQLFIRPALAGGGDLHWTGDGQGLRGTPVAAVVEKLASRDYTYLLLACALAGRLEWFVYAAAIGSWAFVGTLLAYRALHGRRRRAGERP